MSDQPVTGGQDQATSVLPQGLSTAALVLGIIGLVMSIIPWCNWIIAVPCNVLGIVFGAIAGQRIREGQLSGESAAKAGLICGIIGFVIIGLWIVVGLFAATFFAENPWMWDDSF